MPVRSILFLTTLLALGQSLFADNPQTDRCVVLISVDGLANFYLDDPLAEMPTLRRLAKEGARADGLVCSFPTVTWPNHTTLVTGVPPAKHGVIGNNYLDRKSGDKIPFIPDPLFDKHEIVKVPTVYDVAHRAGLTTAGIIWPATRRARTLDWTVPDMGGDDAWQTYGTAHWVEEMRQAGIPVDKHGAWVRESSGGVQRDWLYTRLAAHLFEHHPPNLMLIHLVEVDHVQHKFGPKTPEAYWSVSFADDRIRDIVEAARKSPYGEKTTFVIASDHGFYPIETDIRPNVKLRQLGLIETDGNQIPSKRAWCVAQGGGCMVYILDESQRETLLPQLKTELGTLEGVQAVVLPEDFESRGLSLPADDSRSPDLWLAAKSGYSFTETHTGEETTAPRSSLGGTHGYLPDQPDMLGTLVISGYGIRPGTNLGKQQSINVAPTMAHLLGVEMNDCDGQVIEKAIMSE
ncbi:MAG: alkaline phosphatase family protein [Planctomycetaceae bacterium]|nr:alkaline phosphatase family protein [Planctomycetaceae bacterium]